MDFVEKVKGFLMEPSKTFDATKDEPLEQAIKYFAIIAAIYSAIFALLLAFAGTIFSSMMGFRNIGMMIGAGAGIGGAIIFFVFFLISVIVGTFIVGAIIHIFVYLVGGRRGLTQTIKAIMYGSTPSALLGWIPLIGLIAVIWSLVLEIIGIRQLQELSTGRTILAVIMPIIVLTLILAAVIAAFVFAIGPAGRGF